MQVDSRTLIVGMILSLVVLAAGLPFLAQPFHIDDRIYLEIADQIAKSPLYPYDYAPLFEGLVTPDAASHSHLPLTSYYLALLRLFNSESNEWIYHLGFLIFPLVAVLAFQRLTSKYLESTLSVSALLVLTPGIFVLSHTLMTEVALLAFWLLAVVMFAEIVDQGPTRGRVLGCAIGLAGAAFTSLLAAGLVLLLGTYAFLAAFDPAQKRRVPWGQILLLLAIPLVIWMIWYGRAYLHYDRFVLLRTFQHMDQRAAFSLDLVSEKLLTLLLVLGGAILFPLGLLAAFVSRRALVAVGLVFVACFPVFYLSYADWSLTQTALFAIFFTTGVVALVAVPREFLHTERSRRSVARRRKSSRQALLFLWFLGIAFSCLVLYPSGSVRYAILLIPPVLLAWEMAIERRISLRNRQQAVRAGTLLATALLSLAIGYADFRFASAYQRVAEELVQAHQKADTTVWFTAEWGFRYYLERAGAKPLSRTSNEPEAGDIILKPFVAFPWVTLYDDVEHVNFLGREEIQVNFPIRIQDFNSHAGFYSTAWGILPYSLTDGGPWEWVNVFRVKKRYEGPIPEPERHW